MFKIRCPRCDSKVSRNFDFCPYCGQRIKNKGKPQGLLDEMGEFENGGFNDVERLTKEIGKSMGFDFIDRFPFNQLVKKLSRDIERQFKDIDKEMAMKKNKAVREEVSRSDGAEIRRTDFPGGFSIQIRVGGAPMPVNAIKEQKIKEPLKRVRQEFNEKERDRMARLPKEEPETRVRRLTDKIIYEISLSGVKSARDVTVNQLESSIEIKAISKDRAYFKLIPVALPLLKYYLKEEKLFLELSPGA